jgi:hypothetical protein
MMPPSLFSSAFKAEARLAVAECDFRQENMGFLVHALGTLRVENHGKSCNLMGIMEIVNHGIASVYGEK